MRARILLPLLLGTALLACKKKPAEEPPQAEVPAEVTPPEVELQVVSIDPSVGTAGQLFSATVYGSDFAEGDRVFLGDTEASDPRVLNENTIAITVPPLAEGVYDVAVQDPSGERAVLRRGLSIAAPEQREDCSHLVVYFDFDRSDLRPDALSLLSSKVDCLARSPGGIRVEGHTDERGTTEYNMALGQRRAYAVQRYLVSQGISPSRIVTVSYGEERPAVRGTGEEVWAKNRRAEIFLQE